MTYNTNPNFDLIRILNNLRNRLNVVERGLANSVQPSDTAPLMVMDEWISSATTSVGSGSTIVVGGWSGLSSPDYSDNPGAANPGQIGFTAAGLYFVNIKVRWASASSGSRMLFAIVNGSEYDREERSASTVTTSRMTFLYEAAVGDTLHFEASQNSGSALALAPAPSARGHIWQLMRVSS